MKRFMIILIACAFLAAGSMSAYGGEQAPEKVKNFANNVLVKLGSDSIIVSAVKAENAKKKTLEKIKETDQRWLNTIGTDDFMSSIMNSECSQHLNSMKKRNEFFEEIFVVDNQGA